MREQGRGNSVWHRNHDYDEPYYTVRLPPEEAADDDSTETEESVIPMSMMSMSTSNNSARKKRKKRAIIALVSSVATLFAILLAIGLGLRVGSLDTGKERAASNNSVEGGGGSTAVAECEELLAKAMKEASFATTGGGSSHTNNMPSTTTTTEMMMTMPTSASVPTAVRGSRPDSAMRFSSNDISDIQSSKPAEKKKTMDSGGGESDDDDDDDDGRGGVDFDVRDGAKQRLQCQELLLDNMSDDRGKFADRYDETLLAFIKSELANNETDDDNDDNKSNATDDSTTVSPTPATLSSDNENEPPTTPPTSAGTMSSESSVLFPSPNCTGVFTCLQNSDFHEVDETKYNIDLSLELLDHSNSHAYATARTKWMNIITGNLPPSSSPSVGVHSTDDIDIDRCINDLPDVIDDLHICGRDMEYDGRGGVVGAAGPLFLRRDPLTSKWTTIAGQMRFDVADVAALASHGIWEDVILHEMGHVIGIGTLWYLNGLVDRRNLEYRGSHAVRVWRDEWGCDASAGPPVERDGRPGDGTHGGHWDERCLRDEFMTGTANFGRNPISTLTVASIEDLGYEVDYGAADAYDGTDANCCRGGDGVRGPWSRRRLGGDRSAKSPRGNRSLSVTGRAAAVAHGREVLQKRKKRPGSDGSNGSFNGDGGSEATNMVMTETMFLTTEGTANNDIRYVGDRMVVVLYEEEGQIYDLFVTSEEE